MPDGVLDQSVERGAQGGELFRVLAAGSLAIELLAPASLADRRLARLWALNALAMHWGILGVMGIRFRYQLAGVAFAPFFPVERPILRALEVARCTR